ncbi:hypothetical protein ACQ856_18420 [Mycolicibacterium psychrotolerans]|uniref:hypothetical protein n=1 Tax=Mycolicibacterium psychrotolerans TaxID=216929 RepID=UPI003D66E98A
MPRSGDLFPARRGANDVHNPLARLLDFESPLDMTAGVAGNQIRQAMTSLVGIVQDAIDGAIAALNQIGDIVNGLIVTPINDAVAHFADWFRGLLGFRHDTEANQINLQNFTISTITAQAHNPVWVCRYPVGDVSYPEFMNAGFDIFGTTDGASAGTAHTHTLGLTTDDAFAQSPEWFVPPNHGRGAYVGISNATVIDTIGMNLAKDAGTINNVYLELFRENVDGGLTRLASVDVSALITTTLAYVETAIAGQIVQGGERYLLRVRNATSTGVNVRVQGTRRTGAMPYWGFLTQTSGDTNAASYTAAQASAFAAVTPAIPWGVMAAKNLATTDQSFSDDFNRSALGGLWSPISVADAGSAGPLKYLTISGGKLVTTGSITDGGALFKGIQSAIYVRPTAGDAALVQSNIYPGSSGFKSGPVMHCSRDGSQAVGLLVDAGSAKISTGALSSVTWNDREAVGTGGDGLWSMFYEEPANTYHALKDGNEVGLSWQDDGFEIQHGRDFHYGGARQRRDTGVGSGPMDNWTLRDFKPS